MLPEEVEKQVTIPLEIELSGLPHSVRMFSHTQFGLSFIYITFDDEVDRLFRPAAGARAAAERRPARRRPARSWARCRVRSARSTASISKATGSARPNCAASMDWVVERQFKMVPGVADVVSRGGFIKQYQVIPDLTQMKSRDLTMQQLFAALQKRQRQCRRRLYRTRRAAVHDPRRRPAASRPRTSATSWSPSAPACRSWSAISPK